MSVSKPTFSEIFDNLFLLDDWEDRYRYIIELGQALEPLDDGERNVQTKVEGCVSQVWLVSTFVVSAISEKEVMVFRGDSDSYLVRGLIAILLALYSNRSAQSILKIDPQIKLAELDLGSHLSMQRANGLNSMISRIRQVAQLSLENTTEYQAS